MWSIGRERAILAGGAAALLLQIAHPLVAAAVADHSDFRRDPFLRLRNTLDATLTITFGDRRQAEAAADRVRTTHARIHGELSQPVGSFREGSPYDAEDPDLALWVHATLVMTALDAYGRFVRPVASAVRAQYFKEAKPFAALFGADEDAMPADYASFQAYVHRMVEGGALAVGPQARDLARDILRPPVPRAVTAVLPANRIVTAGLLPPPLRAAFALPWTRREATVFATVSSASRALLPLVPSPLRYWPHYRVAATRIRPPAR